MRSSLFHNSEDEEMVEGVLVKRQECVLLWSLTVNFHHMLHLEGKCGHDRIFVLLDELLSLGGLHLHGSSLFHSGIDLCSIREHEDFLAEGSNERVGIHSTDDIVLRVFLHDNGHDRLKFLDINQVFSLFRIQMPRNQEVIIQEHDTSMFTPIKQSKFFRTHPFQKLFSLILLLETISFSKNECIFVRTDRHKVFVIEFL